jgi:hypothetical protein
VPLLQQPLDPGAGELRRQARQRDVQPDAGELGGDGEVAPLGRVGRWSYQIFDRTRAFDFRITSTMARSKKLVFPKRAGATRER